MLPPYIGWIYGGGAYFSFPILLVMMVIGIWQIPHYWIILIRNKQDFESKTLMPSMLNYLTEQQLKQSLFVWITAFACLTLLPILVGLVNSHIANGILVLNAILLTVFSGRTLLKMSGDSTRTLHLHFSVSLTVFIIIGVESLLM